MTTKIDTSKKPRRRRKPPLKWHLLTNHQNMLYMLAAGMVMGPAGFRGKYYSDPLSVYPGWIPLFRDKAEIPAEALSQATSERQHLLPCIASFDLRELSGSAQMLSRDGSTRNITLPGVRKRKDDIALLVRAPLPLNLLLSINFCSSEGQKAFESYASGVSNVDLSACQLRIAEALFSSSREIAWPEKSTQDSIFDDRNNSPALGQAHGGVLAMLYHAANRSDLGLAVFQLVTQGAGDKDSDIVQCDHVLAELPNWMNGGKISEQADTRARLFWGVIQSLLDAQTQQPPQTPIDVALTYLENQLDQLRETEFRPRLQRLISDMRDCLGLGGGTISELFERHKGSLSRPLLLFCLREHCTDLLEYSHPLLSDAEYILAAILFGVRDGWVQFPRELRGLDLSAYVSFRMSDVEHRKRGESVTIDPPVRPKPLRELFTAASGGWSDMRRDVAAELARECDWNDCFQTRITLAGSDLPESFECKGLQVVLPGRVKSVSEELDTSKFLQCLGQWPPIDAELETRVRNRLAELQDDEQPTNGDDSSCG